MKQRGGKQDRLMRVIRSAKKETTRRSHRELESAILRRCAAGRDSLDARRAPGVKLVKVRLGSTGLRHFPRRWTRKEEKGRVIRGDAEWHVPNGADPTKRMLFLHGGTFVTWAPQDAPYRSLASRFARACNVCVLAIDYRNAPEHKFPAAYDDCAEALQWMAAHGPGSPVEVSPATDLFVSGDSAGGNLALAVCIAPPAPVRRILRGCVGLSAWTDLTASTPSYETRQWDAERCFGDAVNKGTDRQGGRWEAEGYLGRGGVKKHGRDWRASPFFAPPSKLRNMPSVLFHVGDYELILDESVLFCEKMKKAGHRDAKATVYPRMWHVFHQYSEGGGERQPLEKALRAMREIGRWVNARKSRK